MAIQSTNQEEIIDINSINTNSSELFVMGLAKESLRHRAVRHPYLKALAEATLPDMAWSLRDFARHYYGYSAHFPRYLTTVISRLENPIHRKALLENLMEESGVYDDGEFAALAAQGIERKWIDGIPHPLLFERFSDALGVDLELTAEHDQVVCWRELFLQILAFGSPAEAVGAFGLGTENIVRVIYEPLVTAINHLQGLSPRDTVFFPLHTTVDDHHQATLQAISTDFAHSQSGRLGLRRGMLKSLQLRTAFWDWLYERAMNPDCAQEVI
jgi:pyrroloquinoline quinone (PQQ) biosynthesis protein C